MTFELRENIRHLGGHRRLARHDRPGGRPNILGLSGPYFVVFRASPALLEEVLAIIALRATY
jgi:hypothetical protein